MEGGGIHSVRPGFSRLKILAKGGIAATLLSYKVAGGQVGQEVGVENLSQLGAGKVLGRKKSHKQ